MMINKKERDFSFVAFAVALASETQAENARRSRKVERWMDDNDISYNKCIGSYEGQLENSYIISDESFNRMRFVIFNEYQQESVLWVYPNNNAWLVYGNGQVEELGMLEKTGIQNAIDNEHAFTIRGKHAYVVR